MKVTKKTVYGTVTLLVVAVTFGGCWRFRWEPHHNFERLLQGDGEVNVVEVTAAGQGRRIELRDPDSLRYLSQAFRSAEDQGYVPARVGTTFEAEVKVSRAGSVTVGVYVPENADGLTIAYPVDSFGEPRYYWVPLPSPMRGPVSAALGQMRSP